MAEDLKKEESVMKNKNLSWFAALLVFALLLWCTAATPGKIADPSTYTCAVYSTFFSLLPPVIAIVLALNTKEVYTSLLVGIALWGVGMGAQESILKAAVSSMVPKASRATGYGVFECAFGVFWFLGSWLLGVLYDVSIPAMIAVSVAAQLAAIPLYIASSRRIKANP